MEYTELRGELESHHGVTKLSNVKQVISPVKQVISPVKQVNQPSHIIIIGLYMGAINCTKNSHYETLETAVQGSLACQGSVYYYVNV